MYQTYPIHRRLRLAALVLSFTLCTSSCMTMRVVTKQQEGTEEQHAKVASILWGILQSPKVVKTPVCDLLNIPGMSEVTFRRNFGDYLMSTVTIGIYNPGTIYWKCAKPIPQAGNM